MPRQSLKGCTFLYRGPQKFWSTCGWLVLTQNVLGIIHFQRFKVGYQLSPLKVIFLIINMLLPLLNYSWCSSRHYFKKVAVMTNSHSLPNFGCTFETQSTELSKPYMPLLISWSKASRNFREKGVVPRLNTFENPILNPIVHCVIQAATQWHQKKGRKKNVLSIGV